MPPLGTNKIGYCMNVAIVESLSFKYSETALQYPPLGTNKIDCRRKIVIVAERSSFKYSEICLRNN